MGRGVEMTTEVCSLGRVSDKKGEKVDEDKSVQIANYKKYRNKTEHPSLFCVLARCLHKKRACGNLGQKQCQPFKGLKPKGEKK